MKKIANWSKQPITWGGYLKLCAVCVAIGLAQTAYMIWTYTTWFEEATASMRNSIEEIKRKMRF